MITVTFTKNSNDAVFYWDNPITEGKFDVFLTEANQTFGPNMSKTGDGVSASFTFNAPDILVKEFLNKHYELVDDLVNYCNNHNITLKSPI